MCKNARLRPPGILDALVKQIADLPQPRRTFGILSSSPPLVSSSRSSGISYTPYTPSQPEDQQFNDGSYGDEDGEQDDVHGVKGDVWLTGPNVSSPSSPSG